MRLAGNVPLTETGAHGMVSAIQERRIGLMALRRVVDSNPMAIELAQGKTDRDLLVEIVTTLNRFERDFDSAQKDLEPRVRALEQFRWWILGACAGLSFAGGLLGHVIWH